jgi:uncharacterized protein YeaO (DUF488 family)
MKELEQKQDRIQALLEDTGSRGLLLIYAAKDVAHNHAVVLRDFIQETFLEAGP